VCTMPTCFVILEVRLHGSAAGSTRNEVEPEAIAKAIKCNTPCCASPRSHVCPPVHGRRRPLRLAKSRAREPLEEILTALPDGAPSRLFPSSEAECAHRLTA
jgi:hypothetical protein